MGLLMRSRVAVGRWMQRTGAGLEAASYRAGRSATQFSGDWVLGRASMSRILQSDLPVLREKCRDVAMNTATGAAIVGLFSENVSGHHGIRYQPRVRDDEGELLADVNATLDDAWRRWSEDMASVTADGRMTWSELEQLTDESEAQDGETLLRLLPGFRNRWGFAVQVLDPDQLDVQYTQEAAPGRNAIIMGVEVDRWGRAVAYHLWPNHPNDVQRRGERMRVPADAIIHTFITRRAGQLRGVPWMAPVVADVMHLAKYREAEVMAARVAAAKMGFIQGGPNASSPETIDPSPASFVKLGTDETFHEWNPQHPNGNHAAFERAVLHSVASAVRVSFMSLSGDLSQTNFASGQMGQLAEREVFRKLQQRRIRRYSRPVFAAWLAQAIVSAELDVPRGVSFRQLLAADWRPRPFKPVDPLKAAKTDAIDVAVGKRSLTDIVAEDGGDIRAVLEKRRDEIALARELGVPLFLPIGAAMAGDGESASADGAVGDVGDGDQASTPTLRRLA